jgi:type III pantothenate kinase
MSKVSVITVDIGNTSTAMGLYEDGIVVGIEHLKSRALTATRASRLLRKVIHGKDMDGAIVSCVADHMIQDIWIGAVRHAVRLEPVMLDWQMQIGIPITYPRPETIGADRLANAAGAAIRYGTPVIVADFGTALTFDVVTRRGGYTGGVIAPGLPLMFEYLHEKTALLPEVTPGPAGRGAGKSTEAAMRKGALWGCQGMIREILVRLKKSLRTPNVTVCATGGYAEWVVGSLGNEMLLDSDLTLFGLGKIFEMNSKTGAS